MRLVTAVVVLLVLATPAGAAHYYVSTSGNDANGGSLEQPFRTIGKAASIVQPGDVVNVRGGVYNEIVKLAARGTESARITFQSYPGEKAILDGTGTATSTNLIQVTGAYLDIVSFEIRNSTRLGIGAWGANNISVTGNTVHSNYRGGIYFGSDTAGVVTNIQISGNTVYNNALENQYHTATGGWGQAIGVYNATNVTITSNKVFKNHCEGIDFILTTGGLAEGNEVFDNYSINVYLDNAQSITINGNLIYNTGDTTFYRSGRPAPGIATANETYSRSNPLQDLRITNNIVIGVNSGFYYGNWESGGGLKSTTIANNTFYSAQRAMIYLEAAAHENNVIQNNIFYQTGGGDMVVGANAGTTFQSNNWYGGTAGAAAGTGDVIGDPRFVNPGGFRADHYKLTQLSAGLRAGTSLSAVAKDFWGTVRPSTFDLGAHQYSVEGASPSLPPAAPTNLTASAVSSSSISLMWTASTDAATGYKIYRNGIHVTTVTGTSWTDEGLAGSTTYSYAVSAIDASGGESSGRTTATAKTPAAADTEAPTAPANVSATASATTAVIALSWNPASDNVAVTAYIIQRDGATVATVPTTSWIDTGLASATTYVYTVAATDAAGNVSPRQSASATTAPATTADAEAPTMPSGFWVSPSTSSATIYIGWSASADNIGVIGYRVLRNGALAATVTGTTWTDSGLTRSTTYQYSVTAIDAAGNESAAAAGSGTTIADTTADTQAPSLPGNFSAIAPAPDTVTLAWNASADNVGVTSYAIYRNGVLVATVSGTTWTDGGLTASTTYRYGVTATDAAGNASAEATASVATPAAAVATDTEAPALPTGLWASASRSSTRVYLGWTAATDNAGVTGYRIYRDGVLVATVAGTAWTDSGLKRRTTYHYGVSAVDAAGNESAQATVSVRTSK